MQTFLRIALPLSKAALASIGLMFAVAYWNDYTNYKLYITKSTLYNFQYEAAFHDDGVQPAHRDGRRHGKHRAERRCDRGHTALYGAISIPAEVLCQGHQYQAR